ncbi:MAG: hypothetical protein U0989_07550 [Azonexus sp.]|nr:hypothetical protein [Azonexus sp.]
MKHIIAEEIAKAWVAMNRAVQDSVEYHSNFWAYERISDMCEDDPETCWLVIDKIRHIDSSDAVISNLAAGPLGDLLASHGAAFIDRVEIEANNDAVFKKLLAAVWKNDIEDAVWARIKKVAGEPW